MVSNKLKERLILLGGTIGIGAVSLAITLTVYNNQINSMKNNENEEKNKIVFNDDLTVEQRLVANNLIKKLEELEEKPNENISLADEATSQNDDIEKSIESNENNEENIEAKVVKTTTDNIIGNSSNKKDVENSTNEKESKNDKSNSQNDSDFTSNVIETSAKVNKKITFIKPVEGDIGMIFSDDKLVYSKTLEEWLTHKAIDILGNVGTDVKVSADGVVKDMYDDTRYGYTIVIEHEDGYITKYSGVNKNSSLTIGTKLKQGEIFTQISENCGFEIGEGSHLHYEVLKDDKNIKPEFI